MRISFWGAAETVTGSRFVLESGESRILVDCGLFQGVKRLRAQNWDQFPVSPSSLDAVVLTHAHIDHSGYLPRLVRDGFRGPIYCTPATAALAHILLLDSAHLHEEDARRANRWASSRHRPALPLYTTADAQRSLEHLDPVPFGQLFTPTRGLSASFSRAGHILGSACVRVEGEGTSITFTGDVGRPNDPVMLPPDPLPAAEHVVTESTYGNRQHDPAKPDDALCRIVNRTLGRGGTVLVPVFAVGRAQTVLHLLSRLRRNGRIPDVPTYLDSPMAINTTELFCAHQDEHRLTSDECKQMCQDVEFVREPAKSEQLSERSGPMIVLAASGMATGGRVLHHLAHLAPHRRNTVLFTGFQAAGTRGQAMLSGASTIRMFGAEVPVHAEIALLDSLSAHADADELLRWYRTSESLPRDFFVVHGEPVAADTLRQRIGDELRTDAWVPGQGECRPLR